VSQLPRVRLCHRRLPSTVVADHPRSAAATATATNRSQLIWVPSPPCADHVHRQAGNRRGGRGPPRRSEARCLAGSRLHLLPWRPYPSLRRTPRPRTPRRPNADRGSESRRSRHRSGSRKGLSVGRGWRRVVSGHGAMAD
jgi:hypothetical protein